MYWKFPAGSSIYSFVKEKLPPQEDQAPEAEIQA